MNQKELMWKEEFERQFDHYNPIHDNGRDIPTWNGADFENIQHFISTQIIEKLIEEIPDRPTITAQQLKQQLKAKWLSKQ